MEVSKLRKVLHSFPVFLLVLSVLFFAFTQTQKLLKISGISMEPTLNNRDVCFMETFITPEREGIYVVKEPEVAVWAVKRLVGLPGDTVELCDGYTYVNGERILENIEGTWESLTFELGADEYLFLGDNRQDSYDGRYWSRLLNRSDILYHVTYRLWPIHKIGRLE